MPEGISCVSPGFNSIGASMQARRSTPAEPWVAYCGNGYSLPIRGSRMRTSSRRRVPAACAPSAGMGRALRFRRCCLCLVARLIALGNHLDQLAGQRKLAGECQLAFAAALPIHRQRILVLVEREPRADLVRSNHVEVLACQFGERVALEVFGFC